MFALIKINYRPSDSPVAYEIRFEKELVGIISWSIAKDKYCFRQNEKLFIALTGNNMIEIGKIINALKWRSDQWQDPK